MRWITVLALATCAIAPVLGQVPLSITSVSEEQLDPKELAKHERLVRGFCKRAVKSNGDPARLLPLRKQETEYENDFSYLLERGDEGCPKDIGLAIAVLESIHPEANLIAADAEVARHLASLLVKRGNPADLKRAQEINRYLWLRRDYGTREPHWTNDERIAFLSRDDVWAYLQQGISWPSQERDLRLDPMLNVKSSRFDPVGAIPLLEVSSYPADKLQAAEMLTDGKLLPADLPRAEALLWSLASWYEPALTRLLDFIEPRLLGNSSPEASALRLRLAASVERTVPQYQATRERIARCLLPELKNSDPAIQLKVANILADLAVKGSPTAEAAVLEWITPLLGADGDPKNRIALPILAKLTSAGSTQAQAMLEQPLKRHGGLVDGGLWTPDPAKPVPLSKVITAIDYPTRALREEREGTFESTAIFGPDGRILVVMVTGTDDPQLRQTVVTLVTRRMRRSYPQWPGRYVRVKLPKIQFRIMDCDDKFSSPAVEGAVLVEGVWCPQTLIQATPLTSAGASMGLGLERPVAQQGIARRRSGASFATAGMAN